MYVCACVCACVCVLTGQSVFLSILRRLASCTLSMQDVCPEVTNPEQDPMACQPDATAMEGCAYDKYS